MFWFFFNSLDWLLFCFYFRNILSLFFNLWFSLYFLNILLLCFYGCLFLFLNWCWLLESFLLMPGLSMLFWLSWFSWLSWLSWFFMLFMFFLILLIFVVFIKLTFFIEFSFFMMIKFIWHLSNASPIFNNLFMLSPHFNKESSIKYLPIVTSFNKVDGINFHLKNNFKRTRVVVFNFDELILRK